MKNKTSLSRLLKHFLKSSPRSRATQRNGIHPPEFRSNSSQLPNDDQYIKNFITHLDVSYMYHYYGPTQLYRLRPNSHIKTFLNQVPKGLIRNQFIQISNKIIDKKTVLMEMIKQLNKDKITELRYLQCQQFLFNLTVKEVKDNKKLIIFLYKWLLTEKFKFETGSIYQALCQETSELIVKKIYQAHENGDNQLLKNTEEQLSVIQNLQKARENKRNANEQQATLNYETVYWSKASEQIDKVQALQYLCEICKKNKKTEYLQSMIELIRENKGFIGHEKIVKRTIQVILQSQVRDQQGSGDQKKSDSIPQVKAQNKQEQEEFYSINNISLAKQTILIKEQAGLESQKSSTQPSSVNGLETPSSNNNGNIE